MITDLKELFAYRGIVFQLILLSFKTQFRQSLIGPLWHILQPLISSGVLFVIFNEILGTSKGIENPYLNFFSAVLFWNVFLQSFSTSSTVLEGNKHIFSKIYFPRIIPVLSNSGVTLFRFILQLCIYFILYYFTEENFDIINQLNVLLISLILFLHILMIGMTVGLVFASVSILYKDLLIALPFFSNLLFFATPIVYEVSALPKYLLSFLSFNPLLTPIQFAKDLLRNNVDFDLNYINSLAITFCMFFTSLLLFNRSSRKFVDTI